MAHDMDDEISTPRRRGRPPGSKSKRRAGRTLTKETLTRQEFDTPDSDDTDDEEEGLDKTPLFGADGESGIVRIRVTRTDPHEGMVGYLDDPMAATEKDILEKWGGSSYLVQAVGARGQIVKSKVVKIAGDPIFVGTMAETLWRKARDRLSPPSSAAQPGLSVTDLLQLMREQQAETARLENERREREKQADREHAEKMRAIADEADRRRRIDEEDRENRRKRDEEDRERRRQIAQEEADKRQQQFLQQTVMMIQSANQQALEFVKQTAAAPPPGNNLMDSIKTVLAIKEAFGGEGVGDEGPQDPMSLIARHGGEWLQGLGGAVGGAIREWKGGEAASNPGTPPQRQIAPPAGQPPGQGGMMLPPSLAPKVTTLVQKLVARGANPEEELGKIIDHVNSQLDGMAEAKAPVNGNGVATQPQRVEPSPAEASPAPNGVVMMKFGKPVN